jgi:signal transduction histidine kinase
VSIRFKVIIPYVILTLVVAVIGVYVITQLVSVRQEERLRNQLREAGRIVSDEFSKQERQNVEKARLIAYTDNLAESLRTGDRAALERLVVPQAEGNRLEQVFLIDEQGREQLHLFRNPNGVLETINYETGLGNSSWISALLLGNSESASRVFGQNPIDGRYYYYSALSILSNRKTVGAVVIGVSLDSLLPRLKSVSLADVIFYDGTGQIIASTLPGQVENENPEATFSLDQATLNLILRSSSVVYGENKAISGRYYSIARDVLQIGRDRLGIFGVVLPLDFVVEFSAANRNFYILLFTAIVAGVVVLGYGISHMLINPLQKLLRASLAVAGGDLNQRTGIRTGDEIGELAQTFDDMTTRLQERTVELERTYKVLEQIDRTKASFIEVAAHELRTPLTLVKGYTQMLAMKFKDEPETIALTQGILDGSDRMQEIVGSMLDVSRIDSKMLKILPEDANLGVVLGRVRKTFQDALKERNLALAMQGIDGLPVVQADPDQLYKVFYHLVINAIKYTPDGGRITIHGHLVESGDGQNEVEIVVSDTGIGIEPEHHQLIFEKFYQTGEVYMHSSGKTKFKGGGPGLGLAIARGIIEAHGGRIWVESPGHDEVNYPGSKFFVRLPLKVKSNEHSPNSIA